MIVRNISDIVETEREVHDPSGQWVSRRLLLGHEDCGFSLHETVAYSGGELVMHYKHHIEAVYCIDGEGELEDVDSGEKFQIKGGVMYALDGHERHVLRPKSDMRLVCVFNPPLTGREVHDKDGAYPSQDG